MLGDNEGEGRGTRVGRAQPDGLEAYCAVIRFCGKTGMGRFWRVVRKVGLDRLAGPVTRSTKASKPKRHARLMRYVVSLDSVGRFRHWRERTADARRQAQGALRQVFLQQRKLVGPCC